MAIVVVSRSPAKGQDSRGESSMELTQKSSAQATTATRLVEQGKYR